MKFKLTLVAVVLAAGVFLGQFVGIPGLGSGDGGTGGDEGPPPIEEPVRPPVPPQEQGAVVVRIENDQFLIRESSGSFKAASLDEVLQQVKNTPPNTKGIRVCIRRERAAKAGAWDRLKQQLHDNGVEDDQIDWRNDKVP